MRTRNSLLNITSGLIGQSLTLVLGFVVRTIFIYQLGSTYLGVSGLFSNILTLFSFAELGFGQAIVFSLYKPIANNDEEKISSLMELFRKVYTAMFFVILVLGLSLYPFLDFFVKDVNVVPHLGIIYLMYVASSACTYLFAYKNTYVIAAQKNYVNNIIAYFFSLGTAILQTIALLVFCNYFIFLGIQITFSILQNVAIAIKCNKMFPFLKKKEVSPLSKEEKNDIVKNVKALAIYKIGTLSLNATDNIIISKFVGILSVGYYSNYLLLTSSVNSILSTIFNNITASIGNLNASDDNESKYRMFFIINMATFWLYSVVAITLSCCMTPFIHVWIGDEYVLSNNVIFVMVFNIYIAGMLYSSFNYRQTMGLFRQGKIRPIISAVMNIGVSIWLVQYWGIAGVLWGTVITRLTTNGWFDPYIVFKRGFKRSPLPYFADYLLKIFVFFVTGALCFYVTSFISSDNFLLVLLKAIVSFVLANVVYLILFHRTSQFKYLKNVAFNMKSIIKNKK